MFTDFLVVNNEKVIFPSFFSSFANVDFDKKLYGSLITCNKYQIVTA